MSSPALHARLRWLGPPLMASGAALLLGALLHVVQGGAWTVLPWSLFGLGLGLGSFGANNDTALALAWRQRAAAGAPLPDALGRELEAELERDRSALIALRPAPTVGLVLPAVAMLVQAWLAWRLLAGT